MDYLPFITRSVHGLFPSSIEESIAGIPDSLWDDCGGGSHGGVTDLLLLGDRHLISEAVEIFLRL